MTLFADIAQLEAEGRPFVLCTVTASHGSTPQKPGSRLVVLADGGLRGTIGGGAIEHEIRRQAKEVIATMTPRLVEIPLTTVLGMCCGGSVSVFIESLRTRPACILFGAGHVGEALCKSADAAGFDVTVVDPRDELRTPERFPAAVSLRDSYDHDDDYDGLAFASDAFVVIATHDHAADQRIAERVIGRDFAFCAMVGSMRKAVLTRERLQNKGVADDVIARLRCPVGVDIGAETPEEIAVSIVAEMVRVRRAGVASGATALAGAKAGS